MKLCFLERETRGGLNEVCNEDDLAAFDFGGIQSHRRELVSSARWVREARQGACVIFRQYPAAVYGPVQTRGVACSQESVWALNDRVGCEDLRHCCVSVDLNFSLRHL